MGSAPASLVVGLGNPGPEYEATRHNAGFLVVDRLAARTSSSWRPGPRCQAAEVRWGGRPVLLAKPRTYMNHSGLAVSPLVREWGLDPEQVVVVHDDLDLTFGRVRVRAGGGDGGHRGVRSIAETLGTGTFVRVKVGIGRPADGGEVVDFVLSPFGPDERVELSGLLDRAADAVESVVIEGPARAMNRFHSQQGREEHGKS